MEVGPARRTLGPLSLETGVPSRGQRLLTRWSTRHLCEDFLTPREVKVLADIGGTMPTR